METVTQSNTSKGSINSGSRRRRATTATRKLFLACARSFSRISQRPLLIWMSNQPKYICKYCDNIEGSTQYAAFKSAI